MFHKSSPTGRSPTPAALDAMGRTAAVCWMRSARVVELLARGGCVVDWMSRRGWPEDGMSGGCRCVCRRRRVRFARTRSTGEREWKEQGIQNWSLGFLMGSCLGGGEVAPGRCKLVVKKLLFLEGRLQPVEACPLDSPLIITMFFLWKRHIITTTTLSKVCKCKP